MRLVSTLVLPEPAPATTSSGDPLCSTAARCCGLRSSSKSAMTCCGGAAGVSWGNSNSALIVRLTLLDTAMRLCKNATVCEKRCMPDRHDMFKQRHDLFQHCMFSYGNRTPASVVV